MRAVVVLAAVLAGMSPAGPISGLGGTPGPTGAWQSVQVNVAPDGTDVPGDAANEPSIAVDPSDPSRLVIGWRQFDSVLSDFRQAGWALSFDSGRTWVPGGVLEPGVQRTDPVLAADADGRFYYGSLRYLPTGYSFDLFVSETGGATWSAPRPAYGGDKPWFTVDRTTGPGRGHIYVTWSRSGSCCGANTFTRSTDGGLSFLPPVPVTGGPRWGSMDVGPDGTLYIAGVDPGQADAILVAVSTNAREASTTPTFDYVTVVDLGGSVRAGLGLASPNPDGFLGQVWIAAGPADGLVHLLCSVDPPGDDPMDVMFARSTDYGRTWSVPIRVHGDAAGAWQWFGTMSVSPEGRIDVVWNDTRDTGVANWSRLYFAFSYNGGETWLGDVPLSPPWDSHAGWPVQRKIGDYYHMVSDRVGASLAWAATLGGEQDIWFLRLFDYDCNDNGIGDESDIAIGISLDFDGNGIPDECDRPAVSEAGSYPGVGAHLATAPSPFSSMTTIVYEGPPWSAGARLEIVDVRGRLVRRWPGDLGSERRSVVWDGTDSGGRPVSSGVYWCRLVTPEAVVSRRLVLAR